MKANIENNLIFFKIFPIKVYTLSHEVEQIFDAFLPFWFYLWKMHSEFRNHFFRCRSLFTSQFVFLRTGISFGSKSGLYGGCLDFFGAQKCSWFIQKKKWFAKNSWGNTSILYSIARNPSLSALFVLLCAHIMKILIYSSTPSYQNGL